MGHRAMGHPEEARGKLGRRRAARGLLRPARPRAVGDGFSWLAARPTVASVIAGATQAEQVEANVRAVEWTLTPEDLAEVDRSRTGEASAAAPAQSS